MSVTIDLPDEVLERLRGEATRRGVTLAEVVASLAEQLPPQPTSPRRRFAFAGMGSSGRGDLAERHKEIRQELVERMRTDDS